MSGYDQNLLLEWCHSFVGKSDNALLCVMWYLCFRGNAKALDALEHSIMELRGQLLRWILIGQIPW